LTEIDASQNPNYESFVKKLSLSGLPQNGWGRFLRYLAMSLLETGGYYTESFVFPTNHAFSFDGRGFVLPNSGKFTTYDGDHLSLLSGNKQEWNRITSAIINHDEKHVLNDALILRSLLQDSPNNHIVEDSFVDLPYILGLKNMTDAKPFCKHLEKKKGTKLLSTVVSAGFSDYKEYYQTFKLSLGKCKPTIHTFFENVGESEKSYHLTELESWKKAWSEAGWNPVVLTLADAKRHSLYKSFDENFETAKFETNIYNRMCFYRWLAMAASSGGGWMADYDTYPLNLYQNTNYGYELPNNGSFTSNIFFVPNLLSGSESEWNRMVQLLFQSYRKNRHVFWSDMRSMYEIIRENPNAYIHTKNAINLHTVYSKLPSDINNVVEYDELDMDEVAVKNNPFDLKKFCFLTKGKLAVHCSHKSCEKVGFCENNRGPILNKWVRIWRDQCLFDQ